MTSTGLPTNLSLREHYDPELVARLDARAAILRAVVILDQRHSSAEGYGESHNDPWGWAYREALRAEVARSRLLGIANPSGLF